MIRVSKALEGRITPDQAQLLGDLMAHFIDNPDAHAIVVTFDVSGRDRGLAVGGTSGNALVAVASSTALLQRAQLLLEAQPESWEHARISAAVAEAKAHLEGCGLTAGASRERLQ